MIPQSKAGRKKAAALRLAPRRKWLLGLLASVGKPMSFDSLARLVQALERQNERPRYSFVHLPGQGAFSFLLEYDLRVLSERGWIEEKKGVFVSRTPESLAVDFCDCPVKVRHAEGTDAGKNAVEDCAPSNASDTPMVFSVGYEKRSLDEFLSLLLAEGVQVLLDVRKNPLSRKFGFSKRKLKEACQRAGLEYRHEPDLGIPSANRKHLASEEDYKKLFDEYERTVLPAQSALVEKLAEEVTGEGRRMALMCMERSHDFCHRSRLIAWLQAQANGSLEVKKL